MIFNTAAEVRAHLKKAGFAKVKVRLGHNPFGGEDKFFVKLTDIPNGVALVYSGGSNEESKTFGNDAGVVARIAALREALKGTNAAVGH